MDSDDGTPPTRQESSRDGEIEARVVAMRDSGTSWREIERAFSLTRQQARYAYQRGKRVERRAARRAGT